MFTVSRRIRSLVVVALAATSMLLMMVLPASAQYPPGPPPGIVCPPSETPGGVTPPGLVRVCELFGSAPSQSCMIEYEYNPVVEVGEVVTGEDRSVEFELILDRETVGRTVVVTAACFGDPEVLSVSDTFRVAGAADPPVDRGDPVTPGRPLARTGVDAWLIGAVGVLLLGLGIVAVRRRDGRNAGATSGSQTRA